MKWLRRRVRTIYSEPVRHQEPAGLCDDLAATIEALSAAGLTPRAIAICPGEDDGLGSFNGLPVFHLAAHPRSERPRWGVIV